MKLVGRLSFILAIFFLAMTATAQTKPTVAEAQEFMNKAEAQLYELSIKVNRATWVQENFITDDTEAIAADALEQNVAATTELVEQAKRFEGLPMPPELARKFLLLKLSVLNLPAAVAAPKDPRLRKELTEIAVSLDSDYGKGKFRDSSGKTLDISEVETIMAENRDPARLKEVWLGWHTIGAPMRQRYARFVELSNQGAREMGFKDTGALWRAGYDMAPDQFSAELDRLWNQVRPLYLSLFTYVRARLSQKYGPQVVPPEGPLPAHLLGSPWAQTWGNIFP